MTDESHILLKELWPDLPETWDEEMDVCRYECSPYSTGKIGRLSRHDKDCIFLRIKEYLDDE